MAMFVDPDSARDQARNLAESQQNWESHLAANQPHVPVGAFGVGLAAQAQQLQALVEQAHRVRVNHARRLREAGMAAMTLVDTIVNADDSNASSMRGSTNRGRS